MSDTILPDNIAPRIEQIMQEHIGNTDVMLSHDADLQDEFGIDSLELVELGIKLEKEFNIKLEGSGIRHCTTLSDVIQQVRQASAQVSL